MTAHPTSILLRPTRLPRIGLKAMVGFAAASLLFVGPVAAQPKDAARMYRIGYVSLASSDSLANELRIGLREAGYIEGKHIVIEARSADGHQDRLPDLVASVIRQKVDVLVVVSTSTAIAAKQATTTIPIVFASVFDPVGAGIVANLAHPGSNITGAAVGVGGGFGGKWVELMKEAVPGLSRAAVLWNSANLSSARSAEEIQVAARAMNVKLDMLDAGNAVSLDTAFAAIGASRAQAIIVAPDPYFGVSRAKLIQFAASKRLPAVYFFKSYVEDGGLMAYGASNAESVRIAAKYVDKILRGAMPRDLPIQQPTRFELVINLKTAKALGLKIPQSLLVRADQIIE